MLRINFLPDSPIHWVAEYRVVCMHRNISTYKWQCKLISKTETHEMEKKYNQNYEFIFYGQMKNHREFWLFLFIFFFSSVRLRFHCICCLLVFLSVDKCANAQLVANGSTTLRHLTNATRTSNSWALVRLTEFTDFSFLPIFFFTSFPLYLKNWRFVCGGWSSLPTVFVYTLLWLKSITFDIFNFTFLNN